MNEGIEDPLQRAEEECEDQFGNCECKAEVSAGQTNFVPHETTKVACEATLTSFE